MVSSLRYNENIYDFLPLSGNEQRAITVYQDVTGGQRIYAMFKAKEENGEQSDKQVEAVDTFAAKIMGNDGKRHVSEITTQVDFDKIANITSFLYQSQRDNDAGGFRQDSQHHVIPLPKRAVHAL